MNNFLEGMRAAALQRVRRAMRERPLAAIVEDARKVPEPQPLRLDNSGFDVIAEIKRSSPAAGELSGESTDALVDRARAYARAGACAVSVLTEPLRFGGQLSHLEQISQGLRPLGVPAMRKDFIVDVYQVWEAAEAGAGGVLLILRLLDDAQLAELLAAATRAKLFVLLEAFDARDLHRAARFVEAGPNVLVGLNARDLTTLDVEFDRLLELVNAFPENCVRVAESGISSDAQARQVAAAGYSLALVGTALMRQRDPSQSLQGLLAAGRQATGR